jgi:hypothetical protein
MVALVACPIALLGGAERYGDDPLWVIFGFHILLALSALCIAVIIWHQTTLRQRSRWFFVGLVTIVFAIAWVFRDPADEAIDRGGTYLHLLLHRQEYEKQIAAQTKPSKLMVFPRGGMPWSFGAIVYDESDELIRPPEARSSLWRARASMTVLSCKFKARRLEGHFYAAHFLC